MWEDPCCYNQGDECLVTDIAQELTAGLEDTALLDDSLFEYDDIKPDGRCLLTFDSVNERINLAVSDGIEIKEEPIRMELSSGSGSETSSADFPWNGRKSDLDTPPTTPPLGNAHENICVISGNCVTVLPNGFRGKINNRRSETIKVQSIAAKEDSTGRNGEISPRSSLSKDELQKQQAQRRKERMIRNRESAYLSRKRAKEHVSLLETQVQNLSEENQRLKNENSELRLRLCKYEPGCRVSSWRRIPDLPKKTTVLLMIAVTFCVNFHTFTLFDKTGNRDEFSDSSDAVNHHSRSLLWMQSIDENLLSNLSCPVAINQSESMRLERELREWIVGGGEMNPPVRVFKPQPQEKSNRRRKRIPRLRRARLLPLDVWGLKPSLLGLENLYEAIHRRDDTFYLVSFSADHLLLPAMASNATTRPKMSFMLPAFLTNSSIGDAGQVEMMQIDCEVTNTQLLSVRDHDIPSQLRNNRKFANDSVKVAGTAQKEFPTFPDFLNNSSGRPPIFWRKLHPNVTLDKN